MVLTLLYHLSELLYRINTLLAPLFVVFILHKEYITLSYSLISGQYMDSTQQQMKNKCWIRKQHSQRLGCSTTVERERERNATCNQTVVEADMITHRK
jgi:hypothetical protein